MLDIYRKWILPTLFFIPYFIIRICLKIFSLFITKSSINDSFKLNSKLLISAGSKGWESIEFNEIFNSAIEYLGVDSVIQHRLSNNKFFISELKTIIEKNKISHFFYDPRTGRQDFWGGFYDSICIAFLLANKNITPIVYFTDMSFRKWRIKGSIVSAISGIAVCFVAPRLSSQIFPHKRLFGPFLMPFSLTTFNDIQSLIDRNSVGKEIPVSFIGSLYEPRTTILNNIKRGLNDSGNDLIIFGRQLGSPRVPDSEYWKTLIDSQITFTTSDQALLKDFDWTWIPNLVYRYLEAIACGTLLVAPSVPSVERYFIPGKHFVSFSSEEDAINKINYYLENPEERDKIAFVGKMKAKSLIESSIFWVQIDTSLANNNMI